MVFTPVLLTGCVPQAPDNTTTPDNGDTGGDDTNGDTGNDEEVVTPSLTEVFDGVKVTYTPDFSGTLSTDKEIYVNDVKSQISVMSEEVIVRLASEYGLGIGNGGHRLYYDVNGEQQYEDIYPNGFDPYDSDPATYGDTYKITHKDAIREDYYNTNLDYFSWNWSLTDVAYSSSTYIDDYLRDHSDNLQIAIYMIKQNKNIHQVGSNDYNEYISYTSLSTAEKDALKDDFAKEMTYIGMLEEEMNKLTEFILNVIIGETLVNFDMGRFIDVTSTGTFDAEEFVDENQNGVYDQGEIFNDLNNNGVWDSGTTNSSYDVADDYFKNYINTVDSVINTINAQEERYPKIAGIQYQDFTFDQVESTLDNFFVMPTGLQQYKSLIFMNNQKIDLESVWLAFEATRNFNLEIVARYHKVDDGIIFDNTLTNLQVNSGAYDFENNDNDFLIDIESILSNNQVTDKSLDAFVNNTPSYDNPVVLNAETPAANYFNVEKAEDGISTLAKYDDNQTDFFEIMFNATPLESDTNQDPIFFKFGFIDIWFNSYQ
jgi:hypothetical protein